MDTKAKRNERSERLKRDIGENSSRRRILLQMAWRYRLKLGIASIFMGISALATAGYAYLVGPVVRALFDDGPTWAPSVQNSELLSRFSTLIADLAPVSLGGVIVVVAAVKGAAYFAQTWLTGSAGAELLHFLRLRFYENLLGLNPFDREANASGDIVTRFTTDVDHVEQAVTKGIVAHVRCGMELVALAGLALALDPVLGLVGLVAFPPAALLIVRIGKTVRKERVAVHLATGGMADIYLASQTSLAGFEKLIVIKRILPKRCDAGISTDSWKVPPVFGLLQRLGNIDDKEMFKAFNMGIGMIVVVSKKDTQRILRQLSSLKETAYPIGEIATGTGKVRLLDLQS